MDDAAEAARRLFSFLLFVRCYRQSKVPSEDYVVTRPWPPGSCVAEHVRQIIRIKPETGNVAHRTDVGCWIGSAPVLSD